MPAKQQTFFHLPDFLKINTDSVRNTNKNIYINSTSELILINTVYLSPTILVNDEHISITLFGSNPLLLIQTKAVHLSLTILANDAQVSHYF